MMDIFILLFFCFAVFTIYKMVVDPLFRACMQAVQRRQERRKGPSNNSRLKKKLEETVLLDMTNMNLKEKEKEKRIHSQYLIHETIPEEESFTNSVV